MDWLAIYREVDIPAVLWGIFNFSVLLIMFRWHQEDGPFDFRTALLDREYRGISLPRLAQLTALAISSGMLVYMTIKNRMQEWMFIGYMTCWGTVYVVSKYHEMKNIPNFTKPEAKTEFGASKGEP